MPIIILFSYNLAFNIISRLQAYPNDKTSFSRKNGQKISTLPPFAMVGPSVDDYGLSASGFGAESPTNFER